jgi:hypothetical protein
MEVSGQLHAPGSFTPGKRTFGTHWIGGWVDLRVGLDAVPRRIYSSPCQESKPTRHVTRLQESRNSYKILVGKALGKLLFARLRRDGNVNMDLRERDCEGRIWLRVHKEMKKILNSGNVSAVQFRIFCLPVTSLKP